MGHKLATVLYFALFICLRANSQTACTTLGQNPSTAFPVCGIDTFSQSTVPYCGGKPVPGTCSDDGVADYNPFWYKFTCFSAGTLGFLITPNDLADDYDWEIFDITGQNANDIFSNTSLFVACNWSANPGVTGATPTGKDLKNCAGYGFPKFSAMPVLKLNHNYLLLVSHFTLYTPSQNGYKLSFGGGTASITDPLLPDVLHAHSSCDATQIFVKLNKQMKCSSLKDDGSDFEITPAVSTIVSAVGINCDNGFDMDSLMLTLSKPLPPGTYNVIAKSGSDGNTLLDNCDRGITVGTSVQLVIVPLAPTPMDSLTPVGCSPGSLKLLFKKNIKCNSIAADGSDFIVTGPTPVKVVSAQGNCTGGTGNSIDVILSAAIIRKGNYQIKLVKGNDGNTLIDECAQETPVGSTLNFSTEDTVSAEFTYTLMPGCNADTLVFSHDGRNGVNQWLWQLDYSGNSNLTTPTAYFTTFGDKQIVLSVSNGVCSDTVTKVISLGDKLKAIFETNNLLCPEDAAAFVNKSIGGATSFYWDFGDGNTSRFQNPPALHYPVLNMEKIYAVSLIAGNDFGCLDTAVYDLKVLKSCYIAVPNAFTPNGDGVNDYLYPLNAYKADNLEFTVYNRVGQLVFQTKDWTQKWDGTINGNPQDSGIYVWMLKYTNRDTGKKVFQKGSAVLIR